MVSTNRLIGQPQWKGPIKEPEFTPGVLIIGKNRTNKGLLSRFHTALLAQTVELAYDALNDQNCSYRAIVWGDLSNTEALRRTDDEALLRAAQRLRSVYDHTIIGYTRYPGQRGEYAKCFAQILPLQPKRTLADRLVAAVQKYAPHIPLNTLD